MKWRFWKRKQRREQDLDEEIRAHMAIEARERRETGESEEDARAHARRDFGNPALVREVTRDVWGRRWLDTLVKDIRFAIRRLVKSPRFTFTAVAILGLGIGANTAVFSIIDAVYLDDPPHILDPDRLVRVYGVNDRAGTPVSLPYPDFAHYDENQRSFDGLMGWGHTIALTVGHSDSREPARGMFVSHDYFDVLGVPPAAGRWFLPEEDGIRAPQMAAVVSHSFWSNTLMADTDAVGRTIHLNGLTFVVVGVAPEGFAGPSPLEIPPDVWVPFHTVTTLSPRDWEMLERPPRGGGWNWVQGIGRLREGVTVDVARGDLEGLSAYLKETFPAWTDGSVALNADARFMPTDGKRPNFTV